MSEVINYSRADLCSDVFDKCYDYSKDHDISIEEALTNIGMVLFWVADPKIQDILALCKKRHDAAPEEGLTNLFRYVGNIMMETSNRADELSKGEETEEKED